MAQRKQVGEGMTMVKKGAETGAGAALGAGLGPLGWAGLGLNLLGTLLGMGGPSFTDKKYRADPRESLSNAIESIMGLGNSIKGRLAQPIRLRVPGNAPPPTSMPGLGFDIGAGTAPLDIPELAGLDLPPQAFRPQPLTEGQRELKMFQEAGLKSNAPGMKGFFQKAKMRKLEKQYGDDEVI